MNSRPILTRFQLPARICAVCLIVVMASGCASVLRGSRQAIPISSEPQGADILVDGALAGVTPADIQMERKRDHLVTVQMAGYESRSVPVVKSIGGAVWGNILAGGLIGWGVDAATGAQYNLSPETISVQLQPLGAGGSTQAQDDASQVISRLNELDEMRENDEITQEEYGRRRLALLQAHFPELVEEAEAQGAPDDP